MHFTINSHQPLPPWSQQPKGNVRQGLETSWLPHGDHKGLPHWEDKARRPKTPPGVHDNSLHRGLGQERGELGGAGVRSPKGCLAPDMLNKPQERESVDKTKEVTDQQGAADQTQWCGRAVFSGGDGERLALCWVTGIPEKPMAEILCPMWVLQQQTRDQDLRQVSFLTGGLDDQGS